MSVTLVQLSNQVTTMQSSLDSYFGLINTRVSNLDRRLGVLEQNVTSLANSVNTQIIPSLNRVMQTQVAVPNSQYQPVGLVDQAEGAAPLLPQGQVGAYAPILPGPVIPLVEMTSLPNVSYVQIALSIACIACAVFVRYKLSSN